MSKTNWQIIRFHTAAKKGDFAVCQSMMEKLEDKNPRDEDGFTPLHWAAKNGHLELYQWIMEKVKDKNPRDNSGLTPLHLAANNGHLAVAKLITENVQDKNFKIPLRTAINMASNWKHKEVVEYLTSATKKV